MTTERPDVLLHHQILERLQVSPTRCRGRVAVVERLPTVTPLEVGGPGTYMPEIPLQKAEDRKTSPMSYKGQGWVARD